MYGGNNKWYKQLKDILNDMPDYIKHKLVLYKHQSVSSIPLIDRKDYGQNVECDRLIMQINCEHKWFKTTDKFDEIKKLCDKRMVKFQTKAAAFCRSNVDVRIELYASEFHFLIKCITKYFQRKGETDQIKIISNEIRKQQIIYLTKSSLSGVLRIKIAKLFNNIIDPKYIELYKNGKRIKWNECILRSSIIYYKIVLYDTKLYETSKDILYFLNIFKPLHCPHPFHQITTPSISFTIPYKKRFKYKDFIHHIFASIRNSKSTNHLLYYGYEELLDIYYGSKSLNIINDNNNMDIDEYDKQNEEISCVLTKRMRLSEVNQNHLNVYKYSLNGQFIKNKTFKSGDPQFDLFLNNIKSNKVLNLYQIKIN